MLFAAWPKQMHFERMWFAHQSFLMIAIVHWQLVHLLMYSMSPSNVRVINEVLSSNLRRFFFSSCHGVPFGGAVLRAIDLLVMHHVRWYSILVIKDGAGRDMPRDAQLASGTYLSLPHIGRCTMLGNRTRCASRRADQRHFKPR